MSWLIRYDTIRYGRFV